MAAPVKVSVIIPNLHSPIVDQTIASVLAQETDQPFEVIVVGMDKWGLVSPYTDSVKFIETNEPVPPGAARNLGAAAASGEVICFIDSDCIASPNWIKNHFSHHQYVDRSAILGGGVDFPSDNYFTLADNVSTFHEFMVHIRAGEKTFLPSLNLSLPITVWKNMGGFNHNPASEDTDFTIRAASQNISLIFDPNVSIQHLPNRRMLGDIFKHAFVFGNYSIKANPHYWDKLKVPFPLKNHWFSLILSPLLALGVVVKMVVIEKLPFKFWHTLPLVYLIKIAWCFGYAKQLRNKRKQHHG
jgi:glycosyltransferase involved in cell wall biosynthesis